MPRPEIQRGKGKRFQVEWDWIQPQTAYYRLKDGDTVLLEINEDNREVSGRHLKALCDILNELADKVES